jgi:hypothetical protein
MIDVILGGLLLVALYFNRDMKPALLAYGLCIIYQNTFFDSHSPVINHVIYGLIFIPFCYFAKMRLASAMLIYSTFHFFVSVDYFLYPNAETWLSFIYNEIQIALTISLISIPKKVADNEHINRHSWHNIFRLVNIWDNQTHTQKKGAV